MLKVSASRGWYSLVLLSLSQLVPAAAFANPTDFLDAAGLRGIVPEFRQIDPPTRNPVLAPSGSTTFLETIGRRFGHSAIYDPVRERMIVFGGSDGGPRGDTWSLSLAGTPTWTLLGPMGQAPTARQYHSAIYDPRRDRMIVFGGNDGLFCADVWALSLSGTPAWTLLSTSGTAPSARNGHTAVYDPVRDRMIVFGGSDGVLRGDVWALSLAASPPAWSNVTPGTGPSPRIFHSAIFDSTRDRMIVFGGSDGVFQGDVWSLTLSGTPSWAYLGSSGPAPSGRIGQTAFCDPIRDRMVIFGGRSAFALADAWGLPLEQTTVWSALTLPAPQPVARYLHSTIYDPTRDRIMIFGGFDGSAILDALWIGPASERPNISVAPGTLSFGTGYVGYPDTLVVRISNTGLEGLTVSGVTVSPSEFSLLDPGSFVVVPGNYHELRLRFARSFVASLAGSLSIASDDLDTPVVTIPISGEAVPAPGIAVTPVSLSLAAPVGGTDSATLTIRNSGLGPLSFDIAEPMAVVAAPQTNLQAEHFELLQGSSLPPPKTGVTTNPAPLAPAVRRAAVVNGPSVLLISDGGTEVDIRDALVSAGYVVTVAVDDGSWNGANPSPQGFAAIVLPDGPGVGSSMPITGQQALVDYVSQGGGLILTEWIGWEVNSGRYPVLAPLIPLRWGGYAEGLFTLSVVQSHPVTAGVSSVFNVTSAVDLGTVAAGTPVVTNETGNPMAIVRDFAAGRIVHFAVGGNYAGYRPFLGADMQRLLVNAADWVSNSKWLSVSPSNGTVAPGMSQDIAVTADAVRLSEGTYETNLLISSNDPSHSQVDIPATLVVHGDPRIAVSPESLDFGSRFVGQADSLALRVSNTGTAALSVSGMTLSGNEFALAGPVGFSLMPGSYRDVSVKYPRLTAGTANAALTIASSDATNPTTVVALTGSAELAPVAEVSPDTLWLTVASGSATSGVLTVRNSGLGSLSYNVSAEGGAPAWLSWSPGSGMLIPGETAAVTMDATAAALYAGIYPATVRVMTNDPVRAVFDVPVRLMVSGEPRIAVIPGALEFGPGYVGYPDTQTLQVHNTGTASLAVSGMTVSAGFELVGATSFAVVPAGSQDVTVRVLRASARAESGTLTIASNDETSPMTVVVLTGSTLVAPAIQVRPDSLQFALAAGDSTNAVLTLQNTGGSPLTYRIMRASQLASGQITPRLMSRIAGDDMPAGKGEADRVSGLQPLQSGGPDQHGYMYVDSDTPGGPVYEWVDIRSVGTYISVSGDDYTTGSYPIGFAFPYYDNHFTSFNISTNGFVSFSNMSATYGNVALPSPSAPSDMLAIFWDDLWAYGAYYHNDGSRLIIQYNPLGHFGAYGSYEFEVILYPNGDILYQYRSMGGVLSSATIGIQNATGTDGLTVAYNANYVHNDLAVRFSMAGWLSAVPDTGTIAPQGTQEVAVGASARTLQDGRYAAVLRVLSNDPLRSGWDVPAILVVHGDPRIAVSPESLDFGSRFVGQADTRVLRVNNPGTATLSVSDMTLDGSEFSLAGPSTYSLLPGGYRDVSITYERTMAGTASGSLTITSDDAAKPTVVVTLRGATAEPPIAVVLPETIHLTIAAGDTAETSLSIGNTGLGQLTYTITSDGPAAPWLSFAPPGGVVVPGTVHDVRVIADAGALFAGSYQSGLRVGTDDPNHAPFVVPVIIHVTGTPQIAVSADTVRFDSTWVGLPTVRTVIVRNTGTDSLRFAYVAVTNERFSLLDNLPVALGPAREASLRIRFTPLTEGAQAGEIEIRSDDPMRATLHVRIEGIGRHPALAVVTPMSLVFSLDQDASGDLSLTLGNDGLGMLSFSIAAPPDWLVVTPVAGSVLPDASVSLAVRASAVGRSPGVLDGSVRILTNDPLHDNIDVEVSLQVQGVPPGPVAYDSPLDGQVNVGLTPTLRWKASSRTHSYDLFFWPTGEAEPDTSTSAGMTGLSHTLSVPLATGTSYCWRIVAHNASGVTAGTVQTFTAERLPDLVVSLVDLPPTAFSGQPVTMRRVVTNAGDNGTNAPEWSDAFYLSPTQNFDPASAFLLGSALNPTYLAPGEGYSEVLTFPLPQGIVGKYWVFVQADQSGQVRESREENNRGQNTMDMTVQLTPPPDLVLESIASTADGQSGQDITVSWSVRNAGTGDTRVSTWHDAVYLSQDAALDRSRDILLGAYSHSGVLDVDGSYPRVVQARLPQKISGTWYVFVCADAYNAVYEHLREQNNCDLPVGAQPPAVSIVLTPAPDLIVSDIRPPSSALAGSIFEIEWTVRNQGAGEPFEAAWNDRIYLSPTPDLDPASSLVWTVQHTGAVPAGGSYTQHRGFTLPVDMSGTFHVFVHSDFDDQVFEAGEDANNRLQSSSSVDIQLAPRADLIVNRIGSIASPTAGEDMTVNWDIRNAGPGLTLADYWTDRVWIVSGDFWDPDRVIASQDVHRSGSLNTGGMYTASARLSLPPNMTGTARVFVQTDVGGRVFEHQGEANNMMGGEQVEIAPMPPSHLAVMSVTAPAEAVEGEAMTVSWAVANAGPRATYPASWVDEVFLSADDVFDGNADARVAMRTRSGILPAGGSYAASTSFLVPPGTAPNVHVFVATDRSGAVFDDQRADNLAGAMGAVRILPPSPPAPAPDLRITAVNAATEVTAGQPLTVTWVGRNDGAGGANRRWFDAVYLSSDPLPGSDLQLGSVERTEPLTSGTEYTTTLEVMVPTYLAGSHYLLVIADSRSEVDERDGEGNNFGSRLLDVIVPPPSDLVVSEVLAPPTATPGVPVTVSWTLRNTGNYRVSGRIRDGVYASGDAAWDIEDAVIRFLEQTIDLPPGQQVQLSAKVDVSTASRATAEGTVTGPLPGLTPGAYRMLVRTDVRNVIRETNEDNNLGAAPAVTDVGVAPLALGIPASPVLASAQAAYYRLDVGAGLDLSIELEAPGTAWGEAYVAFGRMPTLSDFDFAAATPFEAEQRIVVPSSQAGSYYIMLLAREVPAGGTGFHLLAQGLPFSVLGISPAAGGKDGRVSCTITGAGFPEGVEMFLRDAQGSLTRAESVDRRSTSDLRVRWNLSGVSLGTHEVVARAPDDRTTLPAVTFEVEPQRPMRLGYARVIPGAVRLGASAAYTFQFENISNVDTPVALVLLKTRRGVDLRLSSDRLLTLGEVLGLERADDGLRFIDAGPWRIYPLLARGVIVGEVMRLGVIAQNVTGEFPLIVSATAMSEEVFTGFHLTNIEQARLAVLAHPEGINSELLLLAQDPEGWRRTMLSAYTQTGLLSPTIIARVTAPPAPIEAEQERTVSVCSETYQAVGCALAFVDCIPGIELGLPLLFPATLPWVVMYSAASCAYGMTMDCGGLPRLGIERSEDNVWWFMADVVMSVSLPSAASLFVSQVGNSVCQTVAVSHDPNDILGPVGFGAERWVPVSAPLPYTIRFENDSTAATAAARLVTVRQRLDEHLDPRTFRLTSIGIGSSVFTVPPGRAYHTQRIDLRDSLGVFVDVSAGIDVASREAFWILRAIDPATGQAPENPGLGVLPINDPLHHGEGYVTYTVKASAGAHTGDAIVAKATIVFDNNDPIDTPPFANLIDAAAPSSSVHPLPPVTPTPTFAVSWSGADADSGSGLQSYDVYVRRGNGPYALWLGATTDTSTLYAGAMGESYAFYSIGRDNAGMAEMPATDPDAITNIGGSTAALLSVASVDVDPERVVLEWYSADRGLAVTLYRWEADTEWSSVGTLVPDETGKIRYLDRDILPGERYGYRLGVSDDGTERFYGETWIDVPRPVLALYGALPNPATKELAISFSLSSRAVALLEAFDAAGRRVSSRLVGSLGPGRHVVKLGEGQPVGSGVYFLRLSAEGRRLTAKTVVVN